MAKIESFHVGMQDYLNTQQAYALCHSFRGVKNHSFLVQGNVFQRHHFLPHLTAHKMQCAKKEWRQWLIPVLSRGLARARPDVMHGYIILPI